MAKVLCSIHLWLLLVKIWLNFTCHTMTIKYLVAAQEISLSSTTFNLAFRGLLCLLCNSLVSYSVTLRQIRNFFCYLI